MNKYNLDIRIKVGLQAKLTVKPEPITYGFIIENENKFYRKKGLLQDGSQGIYNY
jgi:hypothetical protein